MRVLKILCCILTGLFGVIPLVENWAHAAQGYRIVTSFYPVYIMARNVAKDVPGVTVENLTPPVTGCLHDYSLTTPDLKKLAGADVFVANGGGMESFLARILTQYPQIKIVELAQGVEFIQENSVPNPHVWVSIAGAMKEVENLGAALSRLDPINASLYQKNTREYLLKLSALRQTMQDTLAPFGGKQIVTFHEAFPYFAREFNLKIAAVIEREPGAQPNARELAETVKLIRQRGLKVLFVEPQYPSLAAETIARETGAKIFTLDPAVSGPDEPDAYLKIMAANLQTLRAALSQE